MFYNIFLPFKGGPLKLLIITQAIILLVIWALAPVSLLPSPVEVLTSFDDMAKKQGLFVELWASILTITQALILSSVFSALIAYTASAMVFRPIARGIAALRFLGFAGITFFFTMITSDGAELKLAMLTFGMTVFQLTNMLAITEGITQSEVDYARTLKLSSTRTVYEILVRGKAHDYLDIIRQNAAIGWTLLSMVEGLVRSEGGIGSLLLNQSKHLHLSGIFAIQLVILFYGIIQDYLLGALRLWLCPYLKISLVKG